MSIKKMDNLLRKWSKKPSSTSFTHNGTETENKKQETELEVFYWQKSHNVQFQLDSR